MQLRGINWGWAFLLIASTAWSQLDLAGLYTNTVKANQPWATIATPVNSLDLQLYVSRGVVTTVATFEYTPGKGILYNTGRMECAPCPRGQVCTQECKPVYSYTEVDLDSLETSVGFQHEDNTAINDMYLWVGAAKVRAELQERALASAQYEDIVKRRKDPALLETWGHGSYSLRIFPGKSGEKRKLQITFVQGIENEGDALSTILPVVHSLAKEPYYGREAVDYNALPNRKIGKVTLEAVSEDGRSYRLDWPGLGKGIVNATPLRLGAADLENLQRGTLSADAPASAGVLAPWVAQKGGVSYFGVKALLRSKGLEFEAEPVERCVILDVEGGKDSLAAERARKLALLSLKGYAQAPYKGNLGFSDGRGGITYLFDEAVSMDAERILKVYQALKAWRPSGQADYAATLKAFAKAAGGGKPRVAILINNQPYAYYQGTWDPAIPYEKSPHYAFEKAQQEIVDGVAQALKAAGVVLFGYWNDWRIAGAATATGGYQLGGLHGWIHPVAYDAGTVDGTRPAPIDKFQLPALFGPGRHDGGGIVDLSVVPSGHPVSNLVVLQGINHFWWHRGGVMLEAASDIYYPYPRTVDSIPLRIAGHYAGSGTLGLKVSGRWGGLRFTKDYAVSLPSAQGAEAPGAAIWAVQQTEAWGRDLAPDDVKAMAALGREYHVVNRQMSLLALEPGVPLWTDLPGKQQSTAGRDAESSIPAQDSMRNPGTNVDGISLEDIFNGSVPVLPQAAFRGADAKSLAVTQAAGAVRFDWAADSDAAAEFRIMDVAGRTVAILRGSRGDGGFSAEWRPAAKGRAYLVLGRAGKLTVSKRIFVMQ